MGKWWEAQEKKIPIKYCHTGAMARTEKKTVVSSHTALISTLIFLKRSRELRECPVVNTCLGLRKTGEKWVKLWYSSYNLKLFTQVNG